MLFEFPVHIALLCRLSNSGPCQLEASFIAGGVHFQSKGGGSQHFICVMQLTCTVSVNTSETPAAGLSIVTLHQDSALLQDD